MSGWDNPNTTKTCRVGASAVRKGQFVKLAAGLVVPCDTLGEAVFGVAISSEPAGSDVGVVIEGETVVETASASMGVDNALTVVMTDANGRAIPQTSTNVKLGVMLDTGFALVDGEAACRRFLLIRPPL